METGEPKVVEKPYNEIFLQSYKDIISKIELPEKSDLDKVREFRTQKLVSDSEDKEVEIIVAEYLEYPRIFDNFKNHEDRRNFTEKLGKDNMEAYNFYNRNKLRRNKISIVLQSARVLKLDGLLNEKELKSLDDFYQTVKEYNNFSIEEKNSFVDNISRFCRDFIDLRLQKNK